MEKELKSTVTENMKWDAIFVSEEEKEEVKRSPDSLDSNEKLRADDSDSGSSNYGKLEIDLDVQDSEWDSEFAKKEDPVKMKDQKNVKLQLKPEQNRKIDAKSLRLDSLKSKFVDMNRKDLEELVYQMVVESMTVKSELADIHSRLDKYEGTLAIYRRRIVELFKKFHDMQLKMDRETTKAPAKITRELGLQVGIPFSSTPSPASPSPLRSPLHSMRAAGSYASSNVQQQLPPQSSSVSYNQSPAPTATVPAPASPVRRGCMQKVTPQRQVPGIGFPEAQVNNQSNNCRLETSPPGTQRPMHASKHTGSTESAAAMRNMSPHTTQKEEYEATRPVASSPSPAKQVPKCKTKVHAMAPKGRTSSCAGPSGSALNYGQQQPNLAPAKPKQKGVLDLTFKDDAAAGMVANSHLRQSSNITGKRKSLGNIVRLSPLQMPRVNARQIVTNNGEGQRNSLGSNVTMQIRSENTPPAATRLRYSHPAPLPSSPAQPFNPAWKLPPSRPLIRISLSDACITIWWNLEAASSRFADCVTYQIFSYQETLDEPSTDSWRHVGDVKAMLLPMVVTVNQFEENQRYYFAVRGVDAHQRCGLFSEPQTWK